MNINTLPMRYLVMDTRIAYFEITYEVAGEIRVTPLSANCSRAAWRTFTMLGIGTFLSIREVSFETYTRLNAEAIFIRACRRRAC